MTPPGDDPALPSRTPAERQAALKRLEREAARLQSPADTPRAAESLRHEITVYQEELLIQNEALISAQSALEETRDRFIELYDFAPSGYLTLDQNGVVLQCNLTAAAMIGRSKTALEGVTMLGLVYPDYRPTLVRLLRRCRSGRDEWVDDTLLINTADGPRYVQFLCRVRAGRSARPELLASMVDITERRQMERERTQLIEERAALASRLLSAQEDQRHRLARNLHDDIGQQVTALRLRLEQLVANADAAPIKPRLEQVQAALRLLDESLHVISSGLRPSALDLGIAPAVRQLVHDWASSSSVITALRCDDFDAGWLAPDVEAHVFRILQEALTNVAKHARAHHVTVVLERLSQGAHLLVEDDGHGFDVEQARTARAGLGLVGMRERVELLGGRLDIRSDDQHGTVLDVTVPLSPPRPPRA